MTMLWKRVEGVNVHLRDYTGTNELQPGAALFFRGQAALVVAGLPVPADCIFSSA